ncbi:hypothetical protein N6H18_10145 [Reichenbachiella agarivorans]|uniref:MetA-pathway of phenol degradation n=1 Tax=Reichenbachiella agarivorans TaxID=2979464 RepID=A0ABY6CJL4_9BACT|nr:hypothetical protein [Reichenbachiella agarivorans]UXP30714.1 hypothetical protein N6H18_10145 [Reichenbachiella agarivorans]
MKILLTCIFITCLSISVGAQTDSTPTMTIEEMAKKRQDPVAGLRSVYLQEVLLPVGDGLAQSFSVQPVWPVRLGKNLKLITYTIIPFQGIPATGGVSQVPLQTISSSGDAAQRVSGLGNILFNGYFSSIEKKENVSWGVGPAVQLPTRTSAALGSNRVSVGPSLLFNHGGDKFLGGFVVQNYWSLGGEGANQVNSFNFQYFTYYNLPKGWFLESNTTVINNWLADKDKQMLLPAGGGGGKTFQIGQSSLFYCATAQLFYNTIRPLIVGKWEAIAQFQVIF